MRSILDQALHDWTWLLLCLMAVALVLVPRDRPQERRRLLLPLLLSAVHRPAALPLEVFLEQHGSPLADDARLLSLVVLTSGLVSAAGVLVFAVALPTLRVDAPRILRDVLMALAWIVSMLLVARRLGFNLSGIIATSAVVTAVIGFPLQDTLGNVIGGLSSA